MDAGRRSRRSRAGGDRFIPAKAGFDRDWDYTTIGGGGEGYSDYQLRLAEALNLPPTRRYFVFNTKPPTPTQRFPKPHPSAKPRRQIPPTPERAVEFESPDVFDHHDFTLSLLDWGTTLSIALGNSVFLFNVSSGVDEERELITLDDEDGPVTSVKWAPDGTRIALGLGSTGVHLMDSISGSLLVYLENRTAVIASMDWLNNHVLTTGSLNSQIADVDVRMRDSAVQAYKGHTKQVCALKWSPSGQQLASGGADNLLYIWDRRKSSHWLHRIEQHTSSVRALAWCPFQSDLLASGGDQFINFWDTRSGVSLNSLDTASQVCSLLWNQNEPELLSSHASPRNQLTLWNYPSMEKMAQLTGHKSRVVYMAPSPDGCMVASAAADDLLMLWQVFGSAKPKPKPKPAPRQPFPDFPRIR